MRWFVFTNIFGMPFPQRSLGFVLYFAAFCILLASNLYLVYVHKIPIYIFSYFLCCSVAETTNNYSCFDKLISSFRVHVCPSWATCLRDNVGVSKQIANTHRPITLCYWCRRSGRTISNSYGAGSGVIWLDEVACLGSENSLYECFHYGWGISDCTHTEDVAIECGPPTTGALSNVVLWTHSFDRNTHY